MSKIRTVLGDINPGELGVTLCHEHVYLHPPDWSCEKEPFRIVDDYDKSLAEVKYYKECGGNAMVIATTIDYGRDIEKDRNISKAAGVHFISVTGYNQDMFFKRWVGDRTPKDLEDLLVKEVTEGVGNTGIRCGIVKASSAYNSVSELMITALTAMGRAQKRTGAPAITTAEWGTVGLERLDILEKAGADLSKVCVAHGDLNPDFWYLKKMMSRGAYVGFDNLGKIKYQTDADRAKVILQLVDAGFQDKIMLSMDLGRTSDYKFYASGLGQSYPLTHFVPRLKEEGLSDKVVNDFLVENPKRWLAF